MNKITFVNGQAPALNAYNLNLLQSNVEQAINDITTDFIVATKSDNQTVVGNNTVTKYLLDSEITSNGTKLTFNPTNSEITIGAGVNFVELSAQVYVFTRGTNSLKDLYIYLNEQQVARCVMPINNDYQSIAIPSLIVAVQENDKITLRVRSGAGSTVFGGSGSNAGNNFLTVKVI